MFPVEPADISRDTLAGDKRHPEPPADISALRAVPDGTANDLPAPVPVGIRVAVKTAAWVLALLIIIGVIGAVVGVVVRIWAWGLGLS